jgi:uncharacterized FAD-dependent dehydrogenase
LDATDQDFRRAAAKALSVQEARIIQCRLARQAVDARDKRAVHWVVSLDVTGRWTSEEEEALIKRGGQVQRATQYSAPTVARVKRPAHAPLVVGMGPAGLFAALRLAQAGWNPIIWERGKPVDQRERDVAAFQSGGALDVESNVQFGEGGAGAFSDGKLTTGIRDPRREEVLRVFAECGAPREILTSAKPHIGTDRLPEAVRALREKILSLGAEIHYGTRLTGLAARSGCIRGARALRYSGQGGTREFDNVELNTEHVILAVGHSARDTLRMLADMGVLLQAKPFAVGVRIEHSQAWLNGAQYGSYGAHPALGAAEYKLAAHMPNGSDIYTFCMCPGGTVVAAASEHGGVVVNGMSRWARDGVNANSALLVGVSEDRFADRPLSGIDFQRGLEEAAFREGGGGFRAPAQRVQDFLARRASKGPGEIEATYPRGVEWCDLDACLPRFIADSLRQGLIRLNQMLPGFASPDAVLTAVESRSSSPARVARDGSYQTSVAGLYAAGEGAGWAGGIVSSAVDGLRAAEAILILNSV